MNDAWRRGSQKDNRAICDIGWGHHCNYTAVHRPCSVLLPPHSLLHRCCSEIATPPEQKTPWIEFPSLNVFPRECYLLWFANRLQTMEEDMIQKLNFNNKKKTLEFLLSEMEYMMGEVSLTEGSEVKFWTYCVWDNFKRSSGRTK